MVVILTTSSWHGFSLWRYIYSIFPGSQAIRVTSRFGIFLLLPAAMGLAVAIDWLARRVSAIVALVCLLAVFAEQAGSFNSDTFFYNKDQFQAATVSVEQALRGDCQSLLFSWTAGSMSTMWAHLLGMWAGLDSEVPTLNGFSGQTPPEWPLGDVTIADRFDRLRLFEGIRIWLLKHPSKIDNVCWVTPGIRTFPGQQSKELYLSFGRVGFRPAVTSKTQTDLIFNRDLHGEGLAVRRAYLALLGRLPRQPELSAAPVEIVVEYIMASPEFRGRERFVFEAYRMLFQHDPSLPVWRYAVEDLGAKRKSAAQLAEEWKGSQECRINSGCTGTTTDALIRKAQGELPTEESEHDYHVLLHYCLLGRAPSVSESDDGPAWIRSVLAR
jgi:hypothetical protein